MAASSVPHRCFICEECLVEESGVVTVKKRGIASLIASSVKRKNPQHRQFLEPLEEVEVHVKCQKHYNSEKMISVFLRRQEEIASTSAASKPTRSMKLPFQFDNTCFLCEEKVTEEYREKQVKMNIERRNAMVKVTLPGVAKTILAKARERGDEWGQKIADRITLLEGFHTDLVAVNAEYHEKCITKFYKMPGRVAKRPGRTPTYDQSMKTIFTFLEENSDECQFTIGQLLDVVPQDSRPHVKTVKRRLEEKYKGDIFISAAGNRESVVSFKNTGHKILSDHWYSQEKKEDPAEERQRIVQTAGKIILEDIRSRIFNTADYPPMDNFFGGTHDLIPQTLLLLLHTIILTNKRGSLESWQTKCLTLAHAIMLAVRPKSFLSPIMVGVASYVYKKFGSKLLLNVLSKLGFSASYEEAARLEGSYVAQSSKPCIDESASPFCQFIFDNADFNVNTLDGHGTFHAMGGIEAITPGNAVTADKDVRRMKNISSSDIIEKTGTVELKEYMRPPNAGLKSVKVCDIDISLTEDTVPSACDIAWLYGKSIQSSTVPGWHGFMEMKTEGETYERSKIVCLPFINAPPSDYSTIYTSILTALEHCELVNQKTCIITFDQPLFWKSRDVVASLASDPQFNNVVIRLGGFHLLMSYMGAMGTIMAGSGLKEMFSVIYAGNSVDKILSGHAYARAVRGHSLAYAALGTVIIKVMGLRGEDLHSLDAVVDPSNKGSEEQALRDVTYKFGEVLKTLENRGPTAALWVQYLRMCALMKNFIRAERSGDWNLHLASVKEMLPYFHAAGHLNYAKSAHLYYQDAINLKDKMDPEEFNKFATRGFFTIRRTDKFWSGVWSDMTIEQVLMRAMKSYGGLTRGRGVTESVLSRWIAGMLCLQSINEQMEVFIGVRTETSEQHVDRRPSRAARDNLDMKKLGDWLADHPPFVETDELLSIGTGAVAPDGVNCYLARRVGITSMKKCLEQENFHDLKLKRKDKVVTMASATCTLKIKNKKFTIDPLTLFQRMCLTKQTEADLRDKFKYELSPFPMSLFTEEGMHKGKKSTLYETFIPVQDVNFGESKCAVIDGGYLLHKVVWSKSSEATFESVCQSYINYVKRHFGSKAIVVFDGYPVGINYQSTKAAERYRRSLQHSSTKFVFTKATTSSTIPQTKFLANDTNKKNFISLLMSEMQANGIQVKQATEDADVMIVKTAIEQAKTFDSVTITGEDIDLLVLLTELGSSLNNVYFEKSGRGNMPSVLYSSHSFKYDSENILFLHAISGCDTTSALFGIGKKKAVQALEKSPWLSDILGIFKDPEASPSQISDAGEQFLVTLYGGNVEVDDLDGLRYRAFQTVVAKIKCQLARLPPTRDAAKYHSYRAYLQVQTWLGYKKIPSAWGWELSKRGVIPITTTLNAAPDDLLDIIRCKCTTGCTSRGCSCRKAGLLCSPVCKNCCGTGCENAPQPDFNEDDTDNDDEEIIDERTSIPPATFTQVDDDNDTNDNNDSNFYEPLQPKRLRTIQE